MEHPIISTENAENKNTKVSVNVDELTEKLLDLKVESKKSVIDAAQSKDKANTNTDCKAKTQDKDNNTVSNCKSTENESVTKRVRKPLSNLTNTINAAPNQSKSSNNATKKDQNKVTNPPNDTEQGELVQSVNYNIYQQGNHVYYNQPNSYQWYNNNNNNNNIINSFQYQQQQPLMNYNVYQQGMNTPIPARQHPPIAINRNDDDIDSANNLCKTRQSENKVVHSSDDSESITSSVLSLSKAAIESFVYLRVYIIVYSISI